MVGKIEKGEKFNTPGYSRTMGKKKRFNPRLTCVPKRVYSPEKYETIGSMLFNILIALQKKNVGDWKWRYCVVINRPLKELVYQAKKHLAFQMSFMQKPNNWVLYRLALSPITKRAQNHQSTTAGGAFHMIDQNALRGASNQPIKSLRFERSCLY